MKTTKRLILILLIIGGIMGFKKTVKQVKATDLMIKNTTTLLEGGARSGKTYIYIRNLIIRALKYPGTLHLAARLRFSHARSSLWMQTIPEVMQDMGLTNPKWYNNSDLILTFPNRSKLLVDGLDDKKRVEKILGKQYASILLNEVSQISFPAYEIVKTRLNCKDVPLKFWMDLNPSSMSHWVYKMFHKRVMPDGTPINPKDYAHLLINPKDNLENISKGYLDSLNELSAGKKRRFLYGEYGSDEGALWKRIWIKYKYDPPQFIRVVVGVDPSGSLTGDEIGIVVAGKGTDGKYYVIDDYTLHALPEDWGAEVVAAYNNHMADCVPAEKNFGGDMVESTITQFGKKNVNVKLITASRGKIVRAEPISAMYQRGEVYHVKELTSLEDELCTTNAEELAERKSPNRMDALVFALAELSEGGATLDYVG